MRTDAVGGDENSKVVHQGSREADVRSLSPLPETWLGLLLQRAEDDPEMALVQVAKEGDLDQLPPTGAVVVAAPLKIVDGSGSPLRVLALVEGSVE